MAVDKDLPPIDVVDREEGEEIRRQVRPVHRPGRQPSLLLTPTSVFPAQAGRDHADVFQGEGGGWQVQLRRGATISVPRALRFDRFVAGQVRTRGGGIPRTGAHQAAFTLSHMAPHRFPRGGTPPALAYPRIWRALWTR